MKIIYPLVLLMLLSNAAIAQQNEHFRTTQLRSAYVESRLFAKLNICDLADFTAPTLQPGVEYRFSKRVAVEFTLGLPVKMTRLSKNSDSVQNKYYKLRLEVKYFPYDRLLYFAPQIFYTYKERTENNGEFIDGEHFKFDRGTIEKSIVGGAIKIGGILPLSRKWHLDGFIGLGPRFTHVRVLNATGVSANSDGSFGEGWFNKNEHELGTRVGPHFTAGFKVAYRVF